MITSAHDGAILNVRVIPRASKSTIGTRDDALLVRLNAPPVDGAANAELIQVLAEALGVSKRDVEIVSGEHSRAKRVKIRGRTAADVERLLTERLSGRGRRLIDEAGG